MFTYIRPWRQERMWILVASDTATSVLYNESRGSVWSFFRPEDPGKLMQSAEPRWIEVVRSGHLWQVEERWRWER